MTEDQSIKDSIFRIGKVVSVDGRTVSIGVDKGKNSSHLLFNGNLVKNVSVNSYIKILKGFTSIICKIEGEFIVEEPRSTRYNNEKDKINRTLRVSLLGFFNGRKFERGIKEMPLIGNECFILNFDEFEAVHNFVKPDDEGLLIGHLALEPTQDIRIGIDSLFASHIGIFGNTGSGKSYTLAKLYFELFKIYKDNPGFKNNAKFFLLDFNGEYVDNLNNIIVETGYKKVYKLSSSGEGKKISITRETAHDIDFWKVILQATEKMQTPFLKRVLNNEALSERLGTSEGVIEEVTSLILLLVDKKDGVLGPGLILEFLSELYGAFEDSSILRARDIFREYLQVEPRTREFFWAVEFDGGPLRGEDLKQRIRRTLGDLTIDTDSMDELDVIRVQITFKYYDEIIKGYANREHLSGLITRMDARFPELKNVIEVSNEPVHDKSKNLTIVSLKNVSVEMKKLLPLLLCKQLYNAQKNSASTKSYLNIIIDEAHNILSTDSFRESESWKDYRLETFEEIIKEGRKFGVFLTLASQRPSDISSTIISQIHNYFIHRLINNNDIHAIEKTVSYLDRISFEYLPILPTGTCIVAGLSSQVPVLVEVGQIPSGNAPNNKTRGLVEFWDAPNNRKLRKR